jgi:hypothetical protein
MRTAHLSPWHNSFELLSWQRASDCISVADYSIVLTHCRTSQLSAEEKTPTISAGAIPSTYSPTLEMQNVPIF